MCYVDWKRSEMNFSRKIWYNICIVTDLKGCCLHQIWGHMCIGRDVQECCHDLIWSAMWIVNDVTGRFHDQFEALCGLDQLLENDVMT
jgi:hypothetical protein